MDDALDKESPEVIALDHLIGEADAERIVLEAAVAPITPDIQRAREKLALLYDERHKLLHQPDNPDDIL